PTRRRGGTGMGLAIARDNLRLQGAEIMVNSQPGKGSVFHFTFPLANP
ncbi:MAG: ATP-binding protein, partial [Planctomycetota bacterium]|nr:ATP-binding protein [Planctomycetota bacterium]